MGGSVGVGEGVAVGVTVAVADGVAVGAGTVAVGMVAALWETMVGEGADIGAVVQAVRRTPQRAARTISLPRPKASSVVLKE